MQPGQESIIDDSFQFFRRAMGESEKLRGGKLCSDAVQQKHDIFAVHRLPRYNHLLVIDKAENSRKRQRNLDDCFTWQKIEEHVICDMLFA
jgi:hypothetical protein